MLGNNENYVKNLLNYSKEVEKRLPGFNDEFDSNIASGIHYNSRIESGVPQVVGQVAMVIERMPEWLCCNYKGPTNLCDCGPNDNIHCLHFKKCSVFWKAVNKIELLNKKEGKGWIRRIKLYLIKR